MNRMCMMIEQILATDRVMAECEKRDAAWETTLETYKADIAEAKDSLRSLIT